MTPTPELRERLKSPTRARIVFALAIGIVIPVASWLFHDPASPIHNYAIWHVGPANALIMLCMPALFVGMLVSGNVHQPSELAFYIAAFAEWFAIGFAISLVLFRKRFR